MDSGLLHQQGVEKRAQEGLSPSLGVMHELEERQIMWEAFLRDPAVWPQPRAKQGPEPFHRVDMDFVKAVPVVISGILTPTVADALVGVAPRLESGVDVVLVRIDRTTRLDDRADEGFDGRLLDVSEHLDEHCA